MTATPEEPPAKTDRARKILTVLDWGIAALLIGLFGWVCWTTVSDLASGRYWRAAIDAALVGTFGYWVVRDLRRARR